MKITLKLFATLTEHLPADADQNAVEVVADALTVHQLIARFQIPPEDAQVILVNGEFMPPEQRDAPLHDGDLISIWPSIQGG